MTFNKFIFLSFILISLQSFSQNNLEYGLKAGLNLSGFHTNQSANTDKVSYHVGGFTEYNINDVLSLQAEILYNKKGGLYNFRSGSQPFTTSVETNLDYIDLPLQAKIYIFRKLSLDLGPQVGILINSSAEIDDDEAILDNDINSIDFTLNGGFSYKLNELFFLQARYSYGLSEVFENRKYKNSVASLSLGYIFE
ncbi:Outer membrane protein beta-barrel domain-containing protein [Nonlabens sp. Hel1_33_55]|uniref:porin family protein n=1 Tax=Nonlabens sp. Hel1_33_55 TaxID=1336802 RepID=UPI000875B693|nr:porin family protein [Nonlabens sp. Hel1_33_55]SCY24182.1 Outer membrane protein beta-barrel domain-containing protein [Nonlabens sp. Hel1_33_55]